MTKAIYDGLIIKRYSEKYILKYNHTSSMYKMINFDTKEIERHEVTYLVVHKNLQEDWYIPLKRKNGYTICKSCGHNV